MYADKGFILFNTAVGREGVNLTPHLVFGKYYFPACPSALKSFKISFLYIPQSFPKMSRTFDEILICCGNFFLIIIKNT